MKITCAFLLLCATLTAPQNALSHSPYLTETHTVTDESGINWKVALLHGDGIFASDPISAVIIDNSGSFVAITKTHNIIYLECAENLRSCNIYDPYSRHFYQPRKSDFAAFSKLNTEGRPEFYPEFHKAIPHGFSKVPASIFETAWIEIKHIFKHPIQSLFFAIFTFGIWKVFLSLFRKLTLMPKRQFFIGLAFLGLKIVSLIILLTLFLYSTFLTPISPYKVAILFFCMLAIANIKKLSPST